MTPRRGRGRTTSSTASPRLAGCSRSCRTWDCNGPGGEIDATPDALPVIDVPGDLPGLVVATGMSGHGFGTSPVVGQIVAALADGGDPGYDLRPFRLARFSDGSRLEPAHLL